MSEVLSARVRGVLFDFDHTLVNSPLDFDQMRRVTVRLCESFGVRVSDPDDKMVLELVEEAASQLDATVARRLRAMADACIRDIEKMAARNVEPLDGVLEALERLHTEGRAIAIITRNCREVVRGALEIVPLRHDVLLTRDDVEHVKPHPDHARAALHALDCAAANALLVGDYRADIECAVRCGIRSVGVATGASGVDELMMAGALTVLTSAAVLPDWLAERGW